MTFLSNLLNNYEENNIELFTQEQSKYWSSLNEILQPDFRSKCKCCRCSYRNNCTDKCSDDDLISDRIWKYLDEELEEGEENELICKCTCTYPRSTILTIDIQEQILLFIANNFKNYAFNNDLYKYSQKKTKNHIKYLLRYYIEKLSLINDISYINDLENWYKNIDKHSSLILGTNYNILRIMSGMSGLTYTY